MTEPFEKLITEYSRKDSVNNYVRPLEDKLALPFLTKSQRENIIGNYTEREIVAHFIRLASINYSVDKGFYPLGSCTMKYNPKINEKIARLEGFTDLHPYFPETFVQGLLQLIYELNNALCELTGFSEFTLTPAAGAHGELVGMLIIKKYFETLGQKNKRVVLIPASAHGTNPASCKMAGFISKTIHGNEEGIITPELIKEHLTPDVAALMITNPNTLGVLEKDLPEIAEIMHQNGSLIYMDGANYNAFIGKSKPTDMGVDVMHFNLHKTFSTPHGGGGPGAGPVGVIEKLREYLPVPYVDKKGNKYVVNFKRKHTIGWIHSFLGNVNILIRAYAYILALGLEGLKTVAETATLNANYLMNILKNEFSIPYQKAIMHEFVIDGSDFKRYGVTTLDVAKRLIDYGFHPPTIYFPLIVSDALMIEPTETESRATLDKFADALKRIKEEMVTKPELLHNAPSTTPVSRPDEKKAARDILSRIKK